MKHCSLFLQHFIVDAPVPQKKKKKKKVIEEVCLFAGNNTFHPQSARRFDIDVLIDILPS